MGCAAGFNEELVQLLLLRDELHVEQDAMLVDIEDLTRWTYLVLLFVPVKKQVCLLNCLSCFLVPSLSVSTGTLTLNRGTRPRKRSLSRPKVHFSIVTFRSMDHVTITYEATFVLTISGKMKTLYAVIITTHGHIYLVWHVRMLTWERGPCLLHMRRRIWTLLSLCRHAITPLIRMMILSLPPFTILHGTHLSVYNESETAPARLVCSLS